MKNTNVFSFPPSAVRTSVLFPSLCIAIELAACTPAKISVNIHTKCVYLRKHRFLSKSVTVFVYLIQFPARRCGAFCSLPGNCEETTAASSCGRSRRLGAVSGVRTLRSPCVRSAESSFFLARGGISFFNRRAPLNVDFFFICVLKHQILSFSGANRRFH